MATIARGEQDRDVLQLQTALSEYERQNPGASSTLFRQNPGSIRVRIINDQSAGMSRSRRHQLVWDFLKAVVGGDLMDQVSELLVLPTAELHSSLANLDFEDPLPSRV